MNFLPNTPTVGLAIAASLAAGVTLGANRAPIPTSSTPDLCRTTRRPVLRGLAVHRIARKGHLGHVLQYERAKQQRRQDEHLPGGGLGQGDREGARTVYDVLGAYKKGPRGWTFDSVAIPVGPVETFDGIEVRWWGAGELPKGVGLKVANMTPYEELKSHRKSTFTFEAGKPLFILDDPDGSPWVMQAFGKIVDPDLTYDDLAELGSKLSPPEGWTYRVAKPDQDLIISTPEGYNWIVQDELQNTYDACKEAACNIQP